MLPLTPLDRVPDLPRDIGRDRLPTDGASQDATPAAPYDNCPRRSSACRRIARAVEQLCDGEMVTVDGHLGIVTVGPPEFDLELA